MNPFLESPDNRIKLWRSFRKSLTAEQNELNQLINVVEYFSKAPESSLTIDVDNPKSWLTPWELLYQGDFCPNGIAYLMEQTLLYAEGGSWTCDRVQLKLVNDYVYSVVKLIVIVDNKYALNYEHNRVVEWAAVKDNCMILNEYNFNPTSKLHSIK